jgi:hypothetical protein
MRDQIEPNRVLNRMGARELTEEEVGSVSAAGLTVPDDVHAPV